MFQTMENLQLSYLSMTLQKHLITWKARRIFRRFYRHLEEIILLLGDSSWVGKSFRVRKHWCKSKVINLRKIKIIINLLSLRCKCLDGIGWSLYCRDLHADGRKHFLSWCRNGRPCNNELFEVIKTSLAASKNALKFYWRNELRIKNEFLLSKFE